MENKSDYAYQELKNRIISGQMPPLSDVSEEQLQKELGVSRTPIREAIQAGERTLCDDLSKAWHACQ